MSAVKQTEFAGDRGGGGDIISRKDLDFDTGAAAAFDRLKDVGAQRVGDRCEAVEGHAALYHLPFLIIIFGSRDFAVGEGDHAARPLLELCDARLGFPPLAV